MKILDGIAATGRMIFRYAVELGILKVNPIENFKLPKQQTKVEDLKSAEEKIKYPPDTSLL